MILLVITIEEFNDGAARAAMTHKGINPTECELETAAVVTKHFKNAMEEIVTAAGGVWAEGKDCDKTAEQLFRRQRGE